MQVETLYIKNMVCNRCIKVVNEELIKIGLDVKSIELGKVVIASTLEEKDFVNVKTILDINGFELLSDRTSRLISRIKIEILQVVHYCEKIPKNLKFSEYLSLKVHHDYSYISNLFSSIEGTTIEKFIILQKIEKAKELLVYDELSLSEIAFQLDYSSVQYLSNQFKKITGLTPTQFKKVQMTKRFSLDKVVNTNKI